VLGFRGIFAIFMIFGKNLKVVKIIINKKKEILGNT
jgi:hypothetical protein